MGLGPIKRDCLQSMTWLISLKNISLFMYYKERKCNNATKGKQQVEIIKTQLASSPQQKS